MMATTRTFVLEKFDRWVESGPFTARDLAIYRIIFAGLMLLRVPQFRIIDAYPDSLYHPPPGPLLLLTGFPPAGFMVGVEIALSIVLVALALGYRTTLASVATTLLLFYGYGMFYSLGKVDHNIFLVILPGVLLFARWGDALSVDAALERRRTGVASAGAVPQWPLRLLATLIGLGFLTAAVPKILYGWLDPRTQAVRGVLQKEYYVNGRTEFLAPYALDMSSRFLWELGDIFAVVIELAFIAGVVRWRAFRTVIALATLFHVGVLLSMNIFFVANVLVYGAFVSWSALRPVGRSPDDATRSVGHPRGLRVGEAGLNLGAVVLVALGGWGVWALRQVVSVPSTSWAIYGAGAAVAVWYLSRQTVKAFRRARHRSTRSIDVRTPGERDGAGTRDVHEGSVASARTPLPPAHGRGESPDHPGRPSSGLSRP